MMLVIIMLMLVMVMLSACYNKNGANIVNPQYLDGGHDDEDVYVVNDVDGKSIVVGDTL